MRPLQYVGEPDLTGPADIPDSLAEAKSVPTTSPSVFEFPLRDGLQRAWDDVWNLVHDRRQPSLEEAAALETRFQELLDEGDRRAREAWGKGVKDAEEAATFAGGFLSDLAKPEVTT